MLEVGRIERPRRRSDPGPDEPPRGAEMTLTAAATADAVAEVAGLRSALRTALARASVAERRAQLAEDAMRRAWRSAVARW